MRKILLIGSNSYIGKHLLPKLNAFDVTATYHNNKPPKSTDEHLDLLDVQSIQLVIEKTQPCIIVLIAAISSSRPDDPEHSWNVNVTGTKNLVEVASSLVPNVRLVFFSSEMVFKGDDDDVEVYDEYDEPNAVHIYGRSKIEAERLVKTMSNYIIIRLSAVWGLTSGSDHDNFFSRYLSSNEMTVYEDVFRSPIWIGDVVRIVVGLIGSERRGVLYLTGADFLSNKEMVERLENVFHKKKKISYVPCPIPNYPRRLRIKKQFVVKPFEDMIQALWKELNGAPT